MKKLILIVLFLFLFKLPVFADEGWIINSFNSNLLIKKDGTIHVEESIEVDFKNLSKHGIYRDIPFRYTNPNGSKLYTEIKNISTGIDQKDISRQGDFVRIRIGDPDKTISGKKSYKISYDAVGILKTFDDHDELYWNVTGNAWPVPIQRVTASVELYDAQIQKVACFEGYYGSTDSCVSRTTNSHRASFSSTKPFLETEGMSIVVGFPKNVIAIPTVKSFSERLFSPFSIATFFITVLGGIFFISFYWYKNGRDVVYQAKHLFDKNAKERIKPLFYHEQVVVEYTSPEKLRPAELGVIYDEKADTLDVSSTIIDLATRGYLTITEEKKKWVFGGVDYTLNKKNKDTKELLSYEKLLYDRLFEDGNTVMVSELKKSFYKDLSEVKKELYKHVVEKGYFARNPESARGVYLGIAVVTIIFSFVVFGPIISMENEYLLVLVLGLIVNALILLIFSRSMSKRTAKGAEINRRVKGYKEFIEHVERYRQQFFEKKNMFNEVLPYAMVFGLTAKFAKALEKMGYSGQDPTWYHGTGVYFSPTRFESNISTFSSSLSSAIVSSPGGSGFSSGGGFSGGGGGGGGGGSW